MLTCEFKPKRTESMFQFLLVLSPETLNPTPIADRRRLLLVRVQERFKDVD